MSVSRGTFARPSKYRSKPVVVGGVRFASGAEARRDAELHLLQRAGKIADLERQPKFDLIVSGTKVCRYIGDWKYREPAKGRGMFGLTVVEDCKGVQTPAFKIKWALAKALFPEIEWRLS